jgi:hypothetical protein
MNQEKREKKHDKEIINAALGGLFDKIMQEYPAIKAENRIYMAFIAIGYRVMLRHGGIQETPSLSDEWLCANHVFADGCNSLRKIIGNDENKITALIRNTVEELELRTTSVDCPSPPVRSLRLPR